jgi:large subunit ribosomal protein L21
MTYAIIKTGGKQYRVEEGQTLLVERLRVDVGEAADVQTLLSVGDQGPADGGAVQAEVVGHERGPKLRVVKFKPKRGYKRRTGHRQDLTRIRITSLGSSSARSGGES